MEKERVEQILKMIKACFTEGFTYKGEQVRETIDEFIEYIQNKVKE